VFGVIPVSVGFTDALRGVIHKHFAPNRTARIIDTARNHPEELGVDPETGILRIGKRYIHDQFKIAPPLTHISMLRSILVVRRLPSVMVVLEHLPENPLSFGTHLEEIVSRLHGVVEKETRVVMSLSGSRQLKHVANPLWRQIVDLADCVQGLKQEDLLVVSNNFDQVGAGMMGQDTQAFLQSHFMQGSSKMVTGSPEKGAGKAAVVPAHMDFMIDHATQVAEFCQALVGQNSSRLTAEQLAKQQALLEVPPLQLRDISNTLSSEIVKIGSWDLSTLKLEDDTKGRVIQVVGHRLLVGLNGIEWHKPSLSGFLVELERSYLSNHYHSAAHGADCSNALTLLVQSLSLKDTLEPHQHAAVVIAGLGHDVGHPGRTNPFLLSLQKHPVALLYNDERVLESFHSSFTMALLYKYNVTKVFNREQLFAVRWLVIQLILATDTKPMFEELAAFRLRLSDGRFAPLREFQDCITFVRMLMRGADINHGAKPWDLHETWSMRITMEFHAQGDEEKSLGLPVSPLCEREGFNLPKSQSGFLEYVVMPIWAEFLVGVELPQMQEADGQGESQQVAVIKKIKGLAQSNLEKWQAMAKGKSV